MFIIQAAVTIVTAGLAERLFNFGWSPFIWSLVILGSCIALLLIGKYPGLDKSMKIIISILTVATFGCRTYGHWCTNTSTGHTFCRPLHLVHSQRWLHYRFYGLDAPLDASIWHSVWTKEKAFYSKQPLSVKGAFADFNVGYLSAAFIGLLFFLLGVLVMFGSGTSFSDNSVEFSSQLVELYGSTLGSWSKPIIAIAAFITMLSTVMTVTDAYPRVISEILAHESRYLKDKKGKEKIYNWSIFFIPLVSLSILFLFQGSFTRLVDFAAGLSFLSAPFLAWFNYKLVTGKEMPINSRPEKAYRTFSLTCLFLLVLFNLLYIYYHFM